MSQHAYVVADVFTDTPLEGNPVAVFLDATGLDGETMQRLARELNLSETVFVLPDADSDTTPIRIFTPGSELPFAGHPVLGAAVVLTDESGADQVTLRPPIGPVPVALRREPGGAVCGEMDQPLPEPFAVEDSDELLAALGIDRPADPPVGYTNGPRFVYVEVGSEERLSGMQPDITALATWDLTGISCFAGTPPWLRVRVFCPGVGVPEDPATGSAAGPLGVHLVSTGRLGFGQELELRQGLEIGRPSLLRVRVQGTGDQIERVVVGGSAVIVARGNYQLG